MLIKKLIFIGLTIFMPTVSLTMGRYWFPDLQEIKIYQNKIRVNAEEKLRELDNWHNPVPTIDAPLDEQLISTPFWQKMKMRTQEEKDAAFQQYALDMCYTDLLWNIQRYQIAAAVSIAKAKPQIQKSAALWESVLKSDVPLAELLLKHGANSNECGAFGPLIFPVKTVEMAKLFISHGAVLDGKEPLFGRTIFHHAVVRGYDPALISYYASRNASSLLRTQDTQGRSPLEYLTTSKPINSTHSMKAYLDEFKKAGITDKEIITARNTLLCNTISPSSRQYDDHNKRLTELTAYIVASEIGACDYVCETRSINFRGTYEISD